MMPVGIVGVGLLGPGLPGWAASRAVLSGAAPWHTGEVVLPPPAILPATERRRAGPVARLALAVASEAATASGLPPASLRPVFGSGNGDSITVGAILDGLTRPDGFVSPTQFHNSVHNAAAGYWSIGTGSTRPATCLGGHDWTFGAALMKAVAECAAEREPVLLCVYDVPMPAPLDASRPTEGVFGAAFVLVPEARAPTISVAWAGQNHEEQPQSIAGLHALAAGNPAARSLPLLEILARGGGGRFALDLLDGALLVTVAP